MTSCANVKNVEYDNGSNEGSFASGWAVQITQEGRYDMEFSVPTRWSHGIRTLRMQLTALAWSTNPWVIVEDTIEWPDFETEDYENSYAPNSAATNNAAVHGALVRWLSRYTFSWSRMVYLYAWDCVALILKYSATDIDEEVHKDGINISIHWSNDNWVTNGVWPWAHISRHYRPSLRYPVV